jgi:3',5'-cyclic AMP phosphodiesterase CpdA
VNSIYIIQLGDVHFPQHKDRLAVDHKDDAAPPLLVTAVAGNPLQQVVRRVRRRLDELGPSTLVVQCGDMTSWGDLAAYDQCVEFLTQALGLAERPVDAIHAVPGNHDVNRDLCDPDDLFGKFDPLQASWQKRSIPALDARNVRVTRPFLPAGQLVAVGANSCVGSGERRYLPEDIRAELAPLVEGRAVAEAGLMDVSEQLDTPAFHETHLALLEDELEDAPASRVAVVAGHHPLLPQTLPRIEIYTEVLNSGVVRSRLGQLGYPVLYLHGHVHADPVEVLSVGDGRRGRLVMIAAPLLADGFNEIRIDLSASGRAIGCTVTQWRRDLDGAVRHSEPLRVPLWLSRRDWISELAREYGRIAEEGQRYRFDDFRRLTNEKAQMQRSRPAVAAGLLEAEWAGYVSIDDRRETDYSRWVIVKGDL